MRDINNSVILMTGIYSKTFDCQIRLTDGDASTDGKVINIPKPKPEILDLTWGFSAHEAAHIRFTDFDLLPEIHKDGERIRWLTNLIEDTRIEKLFLKKFPGVKKYFVEVSKKLDSFTFDEDKASLETYVFMYIRCRLMQMPTWDSACEQLQGHLEKTNDFFFMEALKGLMDKTLTLDSTQEAFNLAKEIYSAIKQQDQKEQEKPEDDKQEQGESDAQGDSQSQSGSQDQDDSDAQGDSQSQSGGQEQDDSDDRGDSQSQSSSQNQDDSDAQGDSQSQTGGQGQDHSYEEFGSKNQSLSNFLNDKPLSSGDRGDDLSAILNDRNNVEQLTGEERAALHISDLEPMSVSVAKAEVGEFEALAVNTTASLRNGVVKLIESQTRTQRVTTKRGRKLAKGKAVRLLTGDTRIFKRKFSERDDIDSHVIILADTSGSMKDHMNDVRVATYALISTLEKIDGATTSAFSFYQSQVSALKAANEPFSMHVKARLASMRSSGGTPATEAYWAACMEMQQSVAKRKVVIMITDGEPNDPSSTKNLVAMLRKLGVVVLCLGVGLSNDVVTLMNQIYDSNWVKVASFDELAPKLLSVAKNVI